MVALQNNKRAPEDQNLYLLNADYVFPQPLAKIVRGVGTVNFHVRDF